MRRVLCVAVAASLASSAPAQPVVPPGFTVRQISPLLDGVVARVEAIDDPQFGHGVIAATLSNGIATIRRISPVGVITSLGSISDPNGSVVRVRLDSDDAIDGNIHFSCSTGVAGGLTNYYTLDLSGVISLRWTETGNVYYDFDISPIGAGEQAVLLDGNGIDGTRLSTMDALLIRTLQSPNSLPAGVADTDVKGLRGDPAGLYGGEMLVADSDCNGTGLSTMWSLSNILGGGTYTAVGSGVSCNTRLYGDLDLETVGAFGGVAYVTEQISQEVQQVTPDGTHTTWATGFVGITSLSISPDGESMYVADLNGVWLIRAEGAEPGPGVLAQDPSTPDASPMTGAGVNALRIIFTEPVSFLDTDVTVTDDDGLPVAFDASGSGSQFMIIGLATALEHDTYTVTLADTIVGVATGQVLDGDNDGVAGGDAVLTFSHACEADIAVPFGTLDFSDVFAFLSAFGAACQ